MAERLIPSPDVHEIRRAVSRHLRRAPDAKDAEAYRWSLTGWRLFETNDLTAAATALERALALNGADPVARYRMGRVQQALKRDPAALAQFEMAIRHAKQAPPPILGYAYLEAARLHERAGGREAALSYYAVAASLFGAAADTRTAATRAMTRLRDREARAPHR
jgi:tetratricopeptide (TPR) repeat protein